MVAAADRTVDFPLFSYLLSFLQCDRYRENSRVESKILTFWIYICLKMCPNEVARCVQVVIENMKYNIRIIYFKKQQLRLFLLETHKVEK